MVDHRLYYWSVSDQFGLVRPRLVCFVLLSSSSFSPFCCRSVTRAKSLVQGFFSNIVSRRSSVRVSLLKAPFLVQVGYFSCQNSCDFYFSSFLFLLCNCHLFCVSVLFCTFCIHSQCHPLFLVLFVSFACLFWVFLSAAAIFYCSLRTHF